MKTRLLFGVVGLIAVMATPALRAEPGKPDMMKVGLWEITTQMEAPVVGSPTTSEVCITKERANPKPTKSGPKDDCQIVEVPSPDGEVSYTAKCSKDKISTKVKFAYFGDRFEGSVVTDFNGVEIRQIHAGKRIGNCDPLPKGPAGTEE